MSFFKLYFFLGKLKDLNCSSRVTFETHHGIDHTVVRNRIIMTTVNVSPTLIFFVIEENELQS